MAEVDPPAPLDEEAPPDESPPGDDLDKWKSLSRKHEKAAKAAERARADLETRMAKFEESSKSDAEKALDQVRREATATATTEVLSKANRRILTAEVKAAAGSKMADPADAVRLLDLDEFDVNDDGEVDAKAIAAAIDGLLADKPYLAAKGGRPRGDVDQGPRPNGGPIDPRSADIAQIEADIKAGARRR